MKNGTFFLKIHLLTSHNSRSRILKKSYSHNADNGGRYEEVQIYLADVGKSDDDDAGSLESVDEAEDHGVVDDTQICRKFVDEDAGRGRIEEFTGASDDRLYHISVDRCAGVEESAV